MGKMNVVPTNEAYSTAMCWETGERKATVYRVIDELGNLSLGYAFHANEIPEVHGEERLVEFAKYMASLKEKNRRRGWVVERKGEMEQSERTQRYPEVRGLRFCPERRKFVGRDVEAAITIGRLRMFELLNPGLRPKPFCRSE